MAVLVTLLTGHLLGMLKGISWWSSFLWLPSYGRLECWLYVAKANYWDQQS